MHWTIARPLIWDGPRRRAPRKPASRTPKDPSQVVFAFNWYAGSRLGEVQSVDLAAGQLHVGSVRGCGQETAGTWHRNAAWPLVRKCPIIGRLHAHTRRVVVHHGRAASCRRQRRATWAMGGTRYATGGLHVQARCQSVLQQPGLTDFKKGRPKRIPCAFVFCKLEAAPISDLCVNALQVLDRS
jgi:hypothetical protein